MLWCQSPPRYKMLLARIAKSEKFHWSNSPRRLYDMAPYSSPLHHHFYPSVTWRTIFVALQGWCSLLFVDSVRPMFPFFPFFSPRPYLPIAPSNRPNAPPIRPILLSPFSILPQWLELTVFVRLIDFSS